MLKLKYLSILSLLFLLNFIACLHHQVKPDKETVLNEETFPKLSIPYSVAIISDSQIESKRCELCGPHYIEITDMTNFTGELLKDIFKKNNISINDKGEKRLIISGIDAKCTRKFSGFRIDVVLTIKAGDSITKQFGGTRTGDGFATTWLVERSIGEAVRKMLEHPDIVQYFQKK
jgi:hypothetical protein